MKIKKVSISVILCALLSGLVARPWDISLPSKGPKPGETGKFVYSEDGVTFKHCLYCDAKKAFSNDADIKRLQEHRCGEKYTDIIAEITQYERENKLYPVCKIGKIPECGPPPEEHKSADDTWICDPGFSNKTYSVYFSCTLVNKRSNAVTWSYYCNESLQWDEDFNFTVRPSEEVTAGSDESNYKTVLIASGVFLVLVVIVLTVVIVCIIYNRKLRDVDSTENSDSSSALMKVDCPPITSKATNNDQGSLSSIPLDGSVTGSDGTVSTSADDKTGSSAMSSAERLPPYGQEGPKSMGHQTAYSFSPQHVNSDLENNTHSSDKETHTGVRGELSGSLISSHRVKQQPSATSHIQENYPFISANNNKINSDGFNNLNREQKCFQGKEAMRSQRPNPLGNITNDICADTVHFDDEEDNRHNTELKQIVDVRLTEGKQNNNCSCSNNHLSRHSHENTHTDLSLQHTSQCTCTQDCESQCASHCGMQSFEITNEMLHRRQSSNDQNGHGHNDSFEIHSYQLKPQNEFYV